MRTHDQPAQICLDSSPLLVNSAGVKTYLHHWIRALRENSQGDSIRIFPAADLARLTHSRKAPWTYPGIASIVGVNYCPLPLIDWFTGNCDIFHISNLLRKIPKHPLLTATIHDTTAWSLPETHTHANTANEQRFLRDVLKRANGLIAVSKSSKDDAVRMLRLNPDRIRVIHPGVADVYFEATAADAASAKRLLGIGKPYCLFVSTIEPRKNVDRLLDAWAAAHPEVRERFDLLLAGMPGWKSDATLQRLRALDADGGVRGVRYLGYVSEALMPGLTAGAAAVLHPSLYEGFGFPVVQAMAAGVAVLTSNVSSMPEVAGGCALLVDPLSASDMTSGIERLMLNDAVRGDLAGRGKIQAQHFRWSRYAIESLKFFHGVLGQNAL